MPRLSAVHKVRRDIMPQAPKMNRLLTTIGGFIHRLHRMNFVQADRNGNVTVKYKLSQEDLNATGDMHAGLSVALLDVISGAGMLVCEGWHEPAMSASINLLRMKRAALGEELTIESKLLRIEGNLAFINVHFFNADGEMIIKGEHVKVKSPAQQTMVIE